MNKERVLATSFFVALSLVFLLQFAVLVSAQANPVDRFEEFFQEVGRDLTGGFSGEGISGLLARVIYFFLVAVIVFSVLDRIPIFRSREDGGDTKAWIRGFIAAVISFLSIAYLTTADIYAILLSYAGLGFVLGTVLPFLILVIFNYDLIRHNSFGNKWLQSVFNWLVFGGFAIWQIFRYFTLPDQVGGYVKPTLWITIFLSVIAIAFGGAIQRAIKRGEVDAIRENARDTMDEAVAGAEAFKAGAEGLAGRPPRR